MTKGLDIAIVGMSGCYAGARDAPTLWRNILNKVDAVTAAGPEWTQHYYDPDSKAPNRIYTTQGGWLHDLAEFDPREFGVMPNAVDGREPDHFLTLKHARNALGDAGYIERPFNREKAGIVIGRGNNVNRGQAMLLGHGYFLDAMLEMVAKVRPDFTGKDINALRDGITAQLPPLTAEILPGLIPNVNTGLVANRLDLMGPNFILDAACASVLVAVEQAARELVSGRCDLMLAGGVHAQTPPQSYMIFSLLNALTREKIRPFQKGASGTLLGEGVGVLVLKRLDDAVAANDRIYAVIKGMGVASDGKAKGLFAPRQEGQVTALKRAYESCGIDPATIGLIEAHATGIPLGDKTEIQSLTQVFGPRRGALPTVAIGSVKSMISHAVPASGGASLIKTALALQQQVLPPTLCDEPSAELELEKTPFYINNQTRPWIHGGTGLPRRAGVNAFGFGGINAHAILEEYVPRDAKVQVQVLHDPESELFLLAGADRAALIASAQQLRSRAQARPAASLAALAKACAKQVQGEHRLAIVATSLADLVQKLDQALEKLNVAAPFKPRGGIHYGSGALAGKVCMLFPGEGAQYPDMLADVCVQFPVARRWFDVLEHSNAGDSRAPIIFPAPTTLSSETRKQLEARLYDMDLAAESVFAASMGLFSVLDGLGFKPDAMLGHSTGENAALTAAKVRRYRDEDEIAQAIRTLNRTFRELDQAGRIAHGTLLSAGALKPEQRDALLKNLTGAGRDAAGGGDGVRVAMDNCPNQLVLFGPKDTMRALHEALTAQGAICQELPFGRAYHTELFKPMADAYRSYFKPEDFGPGEARLYSACTATPFPIEPEAIMERLAAQWEKPVRFTDTIRRLYDDGYRVFVEVGPSSNLHSFVDDILRDAPDVVNVATNSRRKPGVAQLQHTLARLFAAGVPFAPQALFSFREIEDCELTEPVKTQPVPVLNRLLPRMRWPEDMPVPPLPAAAAPSASASLPSAAADQRLQFVQSHFALMQEFLDSQARVLGLAPPGPSASTPIPMPMPPITPAQALPATALLPEPTPGDFPLLGRITEQTASRLVCERVFRLDSDLYLRDHAIGGTPSALDPALSSLAVIPFTFSMEIAAEAAARLVNRADRVVVSIEQSRGNRWLALDENELQLRVVAQREDPPGMPDRVSVSIYMQGGGPAVPSVQFGGLLVFEAVVTLAAAHPAPEAPMAWPAGDERAPVTTEAELYRRGMFHGPRLRGVRKLNRWADTAIEAELETIPAHEYFGFTETPRFQFDAALLDAAGQLAYYWLAETRSWHHNCFPFRVGRVRFYAPPPRPGTRVRCRAEIHLTEARQLEARFDLIGPDGALLMRVTGWEDRVFILPARMYDYCLAPRDAALGQAWLPAMLPAEIAGWFVTPVEDQFLDGGGQIWKRVVAHMVLGPAERAQFYKLPVTGPRREEWLMGRIAAKEALRDWAARRRKQIALADIEILSDEHGAPRLRCAALGDLALPSLSISHSRGYAAAMLGPEKGKLGLDYQRLDGVDAESLIAGSLSEEEQNWLNPYSGRERRRVAAALWCAKEAAAKAKGSGFGGRPLDWRVAAVSPDRGVPLRVRVEHCGSSFDIELKFPSADEVVAYCLHTAPVATPAAAFDTTETS